MLELLLRMPRKLASRTKESLHCNSTT
jgi:hypothetical protein